MTLQASIRIVVLVLLVVALEIACRSGAIPRTTVLAPSEMAGALWDILRAGKYTADMAKTAGNVLLAALSAIILGATIAAAIRGVPWLRRMLSPLFASYYAIPHFVFYPLLIVIFGMNDWPLIAIGFLFGLVVMIVNAMDGFDRIPRVLIKVGHVHKLGVVREFLLIKLPAAAPGLLSGAKLAIAYSVIGVVAGEFILSTAGMGYRIAQSYDSFHTRDMYGLLLLLLGTVTTINMTLHYIEQRLERRWRR